MSEISDAAAAEAAREAADAVYAELLDRLGEANIRPRLAPTRRAVEFLGDPQRAYPVIQIAGTNGKTSTSRMIDSILRAHGLRTGLFTSPHLERFNERIMIDGEPIADEALVANWADIKPYIEMVDAELVGAGEVPLTFFEVITVLAFASFADAPVDVAVIEVGMGGEWDSTNVVDAQVAVFTPIALDHMQRLGSTIEEIARTKSGIIKPLATVVSAAQSPEATAVLAAAVAATESSLVVAGTDFALEESAVAVGGRLITVRGLAERYADLLLPLFGEHQAENAAVAIAAVESFIGGGSQPLVGDVLAEGLATTSSPGRLQPVGVSPTTLVDAAHNPHGAASLATALRESFAFDSTTVVLGVLQEKDAVGIVRALAEVADRFVVTTAPSDRAIPAEELGAVVTGLVGPRKVRVVADPAAAFAAARADTAASGNTGVVVTGSITLVGEAITVARDERWASA